MRHSTHSKSVMLAAFFAIVSITGCVEPIEDGEQIITPAHIDTPVTPSTVDVVLLDGQSNAQRYGLARAIKSEMEELTGRQTEILVCAIGTSSLQTHLLGGLFYDDCAIKRRFFFSSSHYRLVGAILIQGEANIDDTPYIWSDLFKQYASEIRADFEYDTLPVVYTQLPNTIYPEIAAEKVVTFKGNQRALSTEVYDDNIRMVVTEHLPLVDNVHFHISASPELGRLVVEKLYELLLIQETRGIEL